MTVDRNELRRTLEKATPREWEADACADGWRILADDDRKTVVCTVTGAVSNPIAKADTVLIADAINALPSLLDALDAAERERDVTATNLFDECRAMRAERDEARRERDDMRRDRDEALAIARAALKNANSALQPPPPPDAMEGHLETCRMSTCHPDAVPFTRCDCGYESEQEDRDRELNQCDGCRAGIPVDENGNHRMGRGAYPDLMRCQRERYQAPDAAKEPK